MIFWIASYPKSGNTWLRALISSYYYSNDGVFNQDLLKRIDQFPTKHYFKEFDYNQKVPSDTCKFWIKAQEKINANIKELKFFKTHNIFGKVANYDFTDRQNSIGCIYVVRDPRNVLTSLKNHYQMKDFEALKWMTNEKQFIYDDRNIEKEGYSSFQFISSWEINYRSWMTQKEVPFKIVRYEDLLKETYLVSKGIIEFINKTLNVNKMVNRNKLKNSVQSTSFNKLKSLEKKSGFSEAVISKKTNDKIPFFFLGPKNDWKNILDERTINEINVEFNKEMKELGYL